MKIECNQCDGEGELVPEREPGKGKKTGNWLPANDENLIQHCKGGGDLGECDICEGKGFVVTQTEKSAYLMKEVKEAVSLISEIATMSPPELIKLVPEIRLRAICITDQISAVSKAIKEDYDCN